MACSALASPCCMPSNSLCFTKRPFTRGLQTGQCQLADHMRMRTSCSSELSMAGCTPAPRMRCSLPWLRIDTWQEYVRPWQVIVQSH